MLWTEKLPIEYSAIFVMLTRIHRVMHTVLHCFLCALHAIERRAGISCGMNIDEHTSIYMLSLIESSLSTLINLYRYTLTRENQVARLCIPSYINTYINSRNPESSILKALRHLVSVITYVKIL